MKIYDLLDETNIVVFGLDNYTSKIAEFDDELLLHIIKCNSQFERRTMENVLQQRNYKKVEILDIQ